MTKKTWMRFLIIPLLFVVAITSPASATVSEADAKYAQAAGKATQDFTTAIGSWGDTYQTAPQNVNSTDYKNWVKLAAAADNQVRVALKNFSQMKVSSGYKKSDVILRKFVKDYSAAINLYAPAIKKNDQKLVKKANDALLAATSVFSKWGTAFAQDTAALAK